MLDAHLNIVRSSKYIKYLNSIGIETESIFDMVESQFDRNIFDLFINNSEQLLSPNIYIEELVFSVLCRYLNENYSDSAIFEDDAKLDVKSIIAHSKSIIQRPKIPLPSDEILGFKEPSVENGFVRISRFEIQLILKNYNINNYNKSVILFEGLLPVKVETNPLRRDFSSYHIWNNSFYLGTPFIQGLCYNMNDMGLPSILWLNSQFVTLLELRIDNYKNGLRAINKNDEVILEFRYWKDKKIGNGASFVGTNSNIPTCEGCDLILREDYYTQLKKIFPNLSFYTKALL
ncbi:hypothetical protein EC846_0891 [Acinetobacter sp. BIGb0102]|uniref:hypothetical protein n=1 Tax=Acinetobacter sp. BIGb0102 TaxID=2485131 RepID=UPI000F4D3FDD|nr:hypothetical protein [Acinetobacter sp. BIGb0102]RPE31426.1 hypothetical protein EC846_0891 [Acinetobacter sp. BIGb0102]